MASIPEQSGATMDSRITNLDLRLSQVEDDVIAATGVRYISGEWTLRETRQRMRSRLAGESTKLIIASIGDSWSDLASRWVYPAWRALETTFGDSGIGYVGFSWGPMPYVGAGIKGSVDYQTTTVSYSNASDWTTNWATSTTPDICSLTSAVAGTSISVAGGPASCSAVVLHYVGTGGVLRYRWNSGSWTSLTLSGTGAQTASLSSVPSTTWTLDVEVVSGTVTVSGIDVQKTADGIRFHKLGTAGSKASDWAAVDATQWQNSIAALGPHLAVVMLGTNDQAAYDASVFKAHVQTIIARLRAAAPSSDILLVAPCENGAGRTTPMSQFADALFELAASEHVASLDLQAVFGETYAEYGYNSPTRPWFTSDQAHPVPETGGRAITDAILRALTGSSSLSSASPVTVTAPSAVLGGGSPLGGQSLEVVNPTATGLARFYRANASAGLKVTADSSGPILSTEGVHMFRVFTNETERFAVDIGGVARMTPEAGSPVIRLYTTPTTGTSTTVTTWKTGAALAGYVQVVVNGTTYWMPLYTAPSGP